MFCVARSSSNDDWSTGSTNVMTVPIRPVMNIVEVNKIRH